MVSGIVDFHTHAFPDDLAARAMDALHEMTDVRACLDGRVSSLVSSMDEAGIERSVVCCIATRAGQYDSILAWCEEIASERIVPFVSVHPDDEGIAEKIRRARRVGIKGVKLHPYYQDFVADEERAKRIYRSVCDEGLILVSHSGHDFSFERDERVSPRRLLKVKEEFGDLKLVMSHLGGWQKWDEVEELVVGREVYMEVSYSLQYLDRERVRRMILRHPAEYVLFGTDSPWGAQKEGVELVENLELGAERTDLILSGSARSLLGS